MLGAAPAARGRGEDLAKVAVRVRDGITGPRPEGAIGFQAMRGGGIFGEHQVMFAAEAEVLTLSHQALDRSLFAKGAIAAALWVAGKPPRPLRHAGRAGLSELTHAGPDPHPRRHPGQRRRALRAVDQRLGAARGQPLRRYQTVNATLNAVVVADLARARERGQGDRRSSRQGGHAGPSRRAAHDDQGHLRRRGHAGLVQARCVPARQATGNDRGRPHARVAGGGDLGARPTRR